MKNMLTGVLIGMTAGMGVSAYCLSNPSVSRKTNKMLNKAMDNANMMMDDVKRKMRYRGYTDALPARCRTG